MLAQMKLDSASIVTGLLHDTVEDTVATLDDIERLFGPEIGRLVDGVTKLSRIELQSDQTKQAENFRKLVLAMSEDIRVLLVKLADRLHNMQTLRFIKSEEKRRRIARETMDIYAPLAERIGMHRMKDQLEDLAFAELHPDARASILARLGFLRSQGRRTSSPRILAELDRKLAEGGIDGAVVSGREKSPYSIWRKMQRKNVAFEQLVRRDGVPHPGRRRRRVLPRARHHPFRLSRGPRPLQGLHLDPEAEQLPLAAHRGDRTRAAAHRGADPHPRHARGRRARRRGALDLQAAVRPGPTGGNTAGCASCSTSSTTPRTRRNSSSTPSSRCSRTRSSPSPRRAT